MILIDTNVLVAMIDRKDAHHLRSFDDVDGIVGPLGVIDAAIVEAHQVLDDPYLSRRIPGLLQKLNAKHVPVEAAQWSAAFAWLDRYSEHQPDCCDALLVVSGLKIWTYDSEFSTIWRALDGSLVPLAVLPAVTP